MQPLAELKLGKRLHGRRAVRISAFLLA